MQNEVLHKLFQLPFIPVFLTFCMLWSSCSSLYYKGFATYQHVTVEREDPAKSKPVSRPNPCNDYKNYIPDTLHPEYTPMRYIRLNAHFINSKDSTQNLKKEEATRFIEELIRHTNYVLSNNRQMFLPIGNNTPVLPTQYRFVLEGNPDDPSDNGVYFHYNDSLFICNKKERKSGSPYSLFYGQQYHRYGIRKGEVINVFFLEHPPDSLGSSTYKFTSNGVGKPDWAKMVGAAHHIRVLHRDRPDPVLFTAQHWVGLFNHELGHSLGLAHTWNANDGCDDTPMNPNHWNFPEVPPEEHDKVSNNVMDYNAFQNAWSPCQIGKIQLNTSTSSTLQRRLLKPVWCSFNPEEIIHIKSGDSIVWKGAKDFSGNIEIHPDAVLTLHCTVNLAEGAKIKVYSGGTLVVDGGIITNQCGQKWKGIEIEHRAKKTSTIILKNNAQLLNMENDLRVVPVPDKRKTKKTIHPE
ncbi:MAG: hypothetical protein IPM47_18880 [Sphingobacteriales bacterium]|nr:MAG: hypothetical protein IPM47_18880 [Sphingobacteriales bacterium]